MFILNVKGFIKIKANFSLVYVIMTLVIEMKKILLNRKKSEIRNLIIIDYNLVAVIVLLVCFGLVMLYSTSSYMAEVNYWQRYVLF